MRTLIRVPKEHPSPLLFPIKAVDNCLRINPDVLRKGGKLHAGQPLYVPMSASEAMQSVASRGREDE